MTEPTHSDVDAISSKGPACDLCKARKVRCDRKDPCSHCRASSLQCRTTKRAAERRQRISVSGKYDKEIEGVNGRLASLERMLESVVSNHSNSSSNGSPSVSSSGPTLSTPRDSQPVWRDLEYQGYSSFSHHSESITQVIEKGLRSASGTDVENVAAAVATLRTFLNEKPGSLDTAAPSQDTLRNVVDYPELSNLSLPPMQSVLALLRYAKTHPLKYLNDVPNINLEYLTALCQKIYFPTEDFTIATFITVHVCLLNLFRELSPVEVQDVKLASKDRDSIMAVCLKNADVAIRNLRLYMAPTFENIEALLQGCTLAMDLSRASLAWTLITTALRLAQDAGYHRLPPYSVAPEVTPKRRLFWFLYCIERGMALNLGRSSSLQDHDIQTDRPRFPEELGDSVFGSIFHAWFDFAQLQGETYDQLYCARAQRESVQVKAERARKLGSRLRIVQQGFMLEGAQLASEQFGDSIREGLLSISVVQYSTLCLIYRMIPPTSSNNEQLHPLKCCDDAIQAARKALNTHNEAWDVLHWRSRDEWKMFVHWTLIWCPFIPYIVLVGNVIADRNVEDFKLLEKCVETLHSAAQLSPTVSKLHRACRIFYQIAKIYLTQRAEERPQPRVKPLEAIASITNTVPRPSVTIPPKDLVMELPPQQNDVDIDLPDFPLSHEDWNGMLDEWDLGLGAGNAREMSAFFEQYLSGSNTSGNFARNDLL